MRTAKLVGHPVLVFMVAAFAGVIIGTMLRHSWFASIRSNSSNAHRLDQGPASEAGAGQFLISDRRSSGSSRWPNEEGSSRAERYLILAGRAENASLDEFPRLLRMAQNEKHTDLERAIASRWATLNPSHMFDTLLSEGRASYQIWRVLSEEWAKSDPRALVEAAVASKDDKTLHKYLWAIWDDVMSNAPEVGIEASGRLGVRGYVSGMRNVSNWASEDPRAAAESIFNNMTDTPAGATAITEVGKAWGTTDPEAALQYAASRRSSFRDSLYGASLMESVMITWAKSDPEAAASYAAAETDPTLRALLGQGLAAGLAKTDHQAALIWADENLQSSSRVRAIGNVIKTMAKSDIGAASELVSGMDPGGAMNQAVWQLMDVWIRQHGAENKTMLDWVESLSDVEAREKAVRGLEWGASNDSRDWLIDFVGGSHGHLATEAMVQRAAMQRARQDPTSAVAWAQALPQDRSGIALKSVLAAWSNFASRDAAAWISENQ